MGVCHKKNNTYILGNRLMNSKPNYLHSYELQEVGKIQQNIENPLSNHINTVTTV